MAPVSVPTVNEMIHCHIALQGIYCSHDHLTTMLLLCSHWRVRSFPDFYSPSLDVYWRNRRILHCFPRHCFHRDCSTLNRRNHWTHRHCLNCYFPLPSFLLGCSKLCSRNRQFHYRLAWCCRHHNCYCRHHEFLILSLGTCRVHLVVRPIENR